MNIHQKQEVNAIETNYFKLINQNEIFLTIILDLSKPSLNWPIFANHSSRQTLHLVQTTQIE